MVAIFRKKNVSKQLRTNGYDNKLDFDSRIEKILKISGQKSYAL